MIIADSLALSIISVVQIILNAYMWVIIVAALISWVQPDPFNPIMQLLYKLTAPAYRAIRFIPTRIGSVDLAPLIIILVLQFLSILVGKLASFI